MFNDKDEHNTESLADAISQIPGIESLKHKPEIETGEVGEEIVKLFEEMSIRVIVNSCVLSLRSSGVL